MTLTVNVNELQVQEAAKYYASIGIITNPVYSISDKCTSPGKQPIPCGWQIIEKPYSNEAIDVKFKNDKNIGFLCGSGSNLTVIDRDWLRKGIWGSIFSGVDTSSFVEVSHTAEKNHLLFQYCKELKAGQYKALGFDILSDDELVKDGKSYIAGDNCVCAPSMHKDGNKYQITGNIENRPEVPEVVVKRLCGLIEIYNHVTKKVLPKCRAWFRKLWKALFELKDDELYHQTDIFFGDFDNRIRCLHFCAELKVNGAEDEHLLLICKLLFGDRYDYEISRKEISHVNDKPATTDTIKADPYFKRFYIESIEFESKEKKENVLSNIFLDDAAKELTEAEINLLKTNFSQRRLECELPENHFISRFLAYSNRMTDGYQDYKILGGFWLLSSLTQRKPFIDLATSSDGIFLNVWAQFLGLSSLSRKTTVMDIVRHFFAYAQGEPLTDTDYSLEGYLETLAQSPVLAMMNDEVSTVFQKMNQKYNAGYNEFECKLYDCNSQNKRLASGGKKEPKVYPVKDPYITKLYGTTFVKYKRSMSIPDFDSGFGFRFLYAAPTYEFEQRPPRLRTPEDIEERGKMEVRVAQLYNFFSQAPVFSMSVSQDAFDYYVKVDFETQNEIRHKPNQELLGQAWSRYSIYILKLAALIEIGKIPISKIITLGSVTLATSMILNYFLPTLCDVYNLLTVDPQNNKIDKIIECLKEFKGITSHSVLLRKTRLESKEFRSLIETTVESGQVEKIIEKNPKNGKVTAYYHYIDCDEVLFENPSYPNTQVHQVSKFTDTKNSTGISDTLDLFT
jgi:hypothetical protein